MSAGKSHWRSRIGLWKSIGMYYWKPFNRSRLRRFYRQFIDPGDLCFDIGAHVGNRTRAWSDIGATVIAVEPQPVCLDYLRHRFGDNEKVTILEKAVGATSGREIMYLNSANPTISTLSGKAWRDQLSRDARYSINWDQETEVDVTTLSDLIREYGIPAFCKIDVENYEDQVIQGLDIPLPIVSLEYYPPMMAGGLRALERLDSLGKYLYNWSLGESMRLESAQWIDFQELSHILKSYSTRYQYGDVYARLDGN